MNYWYHKHEMPQIEKDSIRRLVHGEEIGKIYPSHNEPVTLYQVSDEIFHDLFYKNRPYLFHGEFTAPADENDYNKGFNIVTESGLAGLYVTTDGWLISVFSNESWRGFVRLTIDLVKDRVKKVVCIVGKNDSLSNLVQLYVNSYDLKIVAETIDDCEIMKTYYGTSFVNQFCKNHGSPHHVFLARRDTEVSKIRYFTDYFQGVDYINNIVGE